MIRVKLLRLISIGIICLCWQFINADEIHYKWYVPEIHADTIIINSLNNDWIKGELRRFKYDKYESSENLALRSPRPSNSEYVAMLAPGKCWRHCIHSDMHQSHDWTLKIDGEVEIDGMKWFVMNSYTDGIADGDGPICYLREDIEARKVWVKPLDSFSYASRIPSFSQRDTVYSLYDFNDYAATLSALSNGIDTHLSGFTEGEVNGFSGQVGQNLAVAQSIGLVPMGITMENAFDECHASSFLGLPAYIDAIDPCYPYLYAVEDSLGQRIFEAKPLATTGIPDIADHSSATVDVVGGSIAIRTSVPAKAEIYDTQGRMLRSLTVTKQSTVSGLPSGTYIVVVTSKAYKVTI